MLRAVIEFLMFLGAVITGVLLLAEWMGFYPALGLHLMMCGWSWWLYSSIRDLKRR